MKKYGESIETQIVHGNEELCAQTGALSPPLYACSNFAFKSAEQGAHLFQNPQEGGGYFYTRMANPTIDLLRKKIALLEGAEEGMAFASGMAAIHAAMIALLSTGDNVIVNDSIYGGTYKLLEKEFKRLGIETRWTSCIHCEDIEQKIDDRTRFLFLETPSNPTTTIYDLEKVCEKFHSFNIPVILDNTFMSPYLQNPIKYGVDIVVHSATKYIGGHADVIGGLIACSRKYYEKILPVQINAGGIISPFDAWLLLRGLKTLHVRMERHCENTMKIAQYLEGHKLVKRVMYPGLPSHPQHELAKKQMRGFGGVLSFELNGTLDECKIFMDNLNIFTLAVSLGDIDSLIQHPASMTHSGYNEELLAKMGVTDQLIRLAVGLENADDLINDLENAFNEVLVYRK